MMVKLFCAIVGAAGSAFPVDIDTSQSVGDLKKAIKVEKMYQFPADELQLLLAKKDEGRGAWLTDDDALDAVLQSGDVSSYVKMRGSWKLSKRSLFGPDVSLGEDMIHVLVVVPESLGVDIRLLQLQEALLQHALLDSPSSTKKSARSRDFKAGLVRTYQCDMGTYQDGTENRMLRCMLLNTALPAGLVIASHLFRHKNARITRELMGFDGIDDVKNGLLLFKPLEHAYDHFQISFIYDQGSNEFRLKVFDPSLRRQRLFAKLDPNQRDLLLRGQTLSKHWKKRGPRLAPGTDFNIQTTFRDVEGQPLCFMSVERPYKRCLNLQARLARKEAIKAKWIHPDEDEFEDFWSEGMSLAEKMDFFSARVS